METTSRESLTEPSPVTPRPGGARPVPSAGSTEPSLVAWVLVDLAGLPGELAQAVAHRTAARPAPRNGPDGRPAGRLGMVVLGRPSGVGGAVHGLQHLRVLAAVRTAAAHPGPVRAVFTGWAGTRTTDGDRSEAAVMADHAQRLGLRAEEVLLEEESSTTYENVRNALPLVEDCEHIALVSNACHALRGRRHVQQLRPDLAERLVRADDHRWFEAPGVALRSAVFEVGMGLKYGFTDPRVQASRIVAPA
ncbi:YdcF family protein [Kytococcus sedentarius]|uniref:YdcF family protein n=1 Tax=Kytococcus sedentarius TaxID=1276 RepID=UPI00384A79E4